MAPTCALLLCALLGLAFGWTGPAGSARAEEEKKNPPAEGSAEPLKPALPPLPAPEPAPRPPERGPAAVPPREEPRPPGAEPPPDPAPPEPPRPAPSPNPAPSTPDPDAPKAPPAEAVELPEPRPEVAPAVPIGPVAETRPAPDDPHELRLSALQASLPPGEDAVFALRGPEDFLATAALQYVLVDGNERECARGGLKLAQLKLEDGMRRFTVPTGRVLGSACVLSAGVLGADDKRIERRVAFRVSRRAAWDGWVALLHAPYPAGRWEELRALGVRGGMAYRLNAERHAALRDAGAPFYVENVARQFLSRYQAERGAWERAIAQAAGDPAGLAPLVRAPSFCAVEFAQAYAQELERHAAAYREDGPLFYSLAAEPSVTRLGAAFDFDFHPEALQEFRRWLERDVYGTLGALNEAWGTAFAKWDEIVPMTTPEALRRLKDGVLNVAPWVDFRAFQDQTFARVLREGRAGLRVADPQALCGITGAQGPFAFGGWDWTRLAEALDVAEAYDIGCARALWRDLAPGKPALSLIPLASAPDALLEARRALWSTALDGGPRGALLWDEAAGSGAGIGARERILLDAGGKPTPAAEVLAPTLRELDGPLGRLLAGARREAGGVALLYSPASVRVHWLLEAARLHGDDWLKTWGADSAAERRESPQLRLRESWAKLLADLGLPWRFVSSAEVEKGVLLSGPRPFRAIVLPRALALSEDEADALRRFAQEGGLVVADAACGRYDEHGRLRKKPALDEVLGLDTSREPFSVEPERPLDSIKEVAPAGQAAGWPAPDDLSLPPAYSAEPLWAGAPPPKRWEFRGSPALVRRTAGKGAFVYLNLNLEDYLHWRLHPNRPRASAARAVLDRLAFGALQAGLSEDLAASALPAGTEIVRMSLGTGPGTAHLYALRRNPQGRLHELGNEDDENACFERSEPFKLVLREKSWIVPLQSEKPPAEGALLEGTLDPVVPALFVVHARAQAAPKLGLPVTVKAGETLALTLGPGAEGQGARLYSLRVAGPDGVERHAYGGSFWAPDGARELKVPLALNDPPGAWKVSLKDVTAGLETAGTFKVGVSE